MEKTFYSAKDYQIDNIKGEYLCRCNCCGTILLDENPDCDSPKYALKHTEENMEQQEDENGIYYVCPHCGTDEYLVDLSNT